MKENFDYHILIVELLAGKGEAPTVKVQCRGAEKSDCACTPRRCEVKYLIEMIGAWDAIRAAGDIELARFSARMDWSDPEEPWVDVEP